MLRNGVAERNRRAGPVNLKRESAASDWRLIHNLIAPSRQLWRARWGIAPHAFGYFLRADVQFWLIAIGAGEPIESMTSKRVPSGVMSKHAPKDKLLQSVRISKSLRAGLTCSLPADATTEAEISVLCEK